MNWKIIWNEGALQDLKKLDKFIQKKLLHFLNTRIAPLENPRVRGKPLSYEKFGLWRYRVEDFRIVCRIDDAEITILVVQIGYRKNIYD